jgi:hypothetical protein
METPNIEETTMYPAEICPAFLLHRKGQILQSIKVTPCLQFQHQGLSSAMNQFSF